MVYLYPVFYCPIPAKVPLFVPEIWGDSPWALAIHRFNPWPYLDSDIPYLKKNSPTNALISCRPCDLGYACPNVTTEALCPAGTYALPLATACLACHANSYTGQKTCPAGLTVQTSHSVTDRVSSAALNSPPGRHARHQRKRAVHLADAHLQWPELQRQHLVVLRPVCLLHRHASHFPGRADDGDDDHVCEHGGRNEAQQHGGGGADVSVCVQAVPDTGGRDDQLVPDAHLPRVVLLVGALVHRLVIAGQLVLPPRCDMQLHDPQPETGRGSPIIPQQPARALRAAHHLQADVRARAQIPHEAGQKPFSFGHLFKGGLTPDELILNYKDGRVTVNVYQDPRKMALKPSCRRGCPSQSTRRTNSGFHLIKVASCLKQTRRSC